MKASIWIVLVTTVVTTLVFARGPIPELLRTRTMTAVSKYSAAGYDLTPLPQSRIDELASRLSEEEARILLNKGTEPAFCGNLLDNRKEGLYLCRLCNLPLFDSSAKFTSGTGWPSFFQPFDPRHITYKKDDSFGMKRVEILCARCAGHLGHVFDDGPDPTGLRYCLNSASLEFVERGRELPPMAKPDIRTETAFFAGGCFWGVEDRFQQVPGVIDAESGYMGGKTDRPTYKLVCSGRTGHAETVKVVFDPARVSYEELLERFFQFHDPTQVDRQGPDIGTQYRSAIFPADDRQREIALRFIDRKQQSEQFRNRPIATRVEEPGHTFWRAEEYHQDYHAKHGGSCAIPPPPGG